MDKVTTCYGILRSETTIITKRKGITVISFLLELTKDVVEQLVLALFILSFTILGFSRGGAIGVNDGHNSQKSSKHLKREERWLLKR